MLRITSSQSRKARSLAHPRPVWDSYTLWCWIDMRDRECSTTTVDWDRGTPVSCLALHSSVSGVGLAQRLVHPFGGVATHARYPMRARSRMLDPSLTPTRTQYPAIVGNRGSKKPLSNAVFANPWNVEQPLTAHS
jgi:hypothetical protein